MVESTRDQIDPSQHQASTLAQKKNKNKDDVPSIPEDPLVNEICRYQKSEDGASCVTVKEPCVKGATEVPPAGKCPARDSISTRSATAPVVKVDKAPAIDAPKTDAEKKEEKKEEKKAALAQKKNRDDDVPSIPEDPLVNEICRYQKSEDGASCVTVKEPCVKGATEVPPAGKCPARDSISSRSATPPVVKTEKAPAIDAPKTDAEKKEEKKEEKKAALAQKKNKEDDVPSIPEDPLVNEICRYQKSEDGASCVTIKEPCLKANTEVPTAG